MKDVYFCMLTNNQSTINHKIPFYTAKSYHSTILVWYEGLGVSCLWHFLNLYRGFQNSKIALLKGSITQILLNKKHFPSYICNLQ